MALLSTNASRQQSLGSVRVAPSGLRRYTHEQPIDATRIAPSAAVCAGAAGVAGGGIDDYGHPAQCGRHGGQGCVFGRVCRAPSCGQRDGSGCTARQRRAGSDRSLHRRARTTRDSPLRGAVRTPGAVVAAARMCARYGSRQRRPCAAPIGCCGSALATGRYRAVGRPVGTGGGRGGSAPGDSQCLRRRRRSAGSQCARHRRHPQGPGTGAANGSGLCARYAAARMVDDQDRAGHAELQAGSADRYVAGATGGGRHGGSARAGHG